MTHPIKERTEMKKLRDDEGREGVQKRVDRNVMMTVVEMPSRCIGCGVDACGRARVPPTRDQQCRVQPVVNLAFTKIPTDPFSIYPYLKDNTKTTASTLHTHCKPPFCIRVSLKHRQRGSRQ